MCKGQNFMTVNIQWGKLGGGISIELIRKIVLFQSRLSTYLSTCFLTLLDTFVSTFLSCCCVKCHLDWIFSSNHLWTEKNDPGTKCWTAAKVAATRELPLTSLPSCRARHSLPGLKLLRSLLNHLITRWRWWNLLIVLCRRGDRLYLTELRNIEMTESCFERQQRISLLTPTFTSYRNLLSTSTFSINFSKPI